MGMEVEVEVTPETVRKNTTPFVLARGGGW
jgi:hypothetical protein